MIIFFFFKMVSGCGPGWPQFQRSAFLYPLSDTMPGPLVYSFMILSIYTCIKVLPPLSYFSPISAGSLSFLQITFPYLLVWLCFVFHNFTSAICVSTPRAYELTSGYATRYLEDGIFVASFPILWLLHYFYLLFYSILQTLGG